MLVTNYYASFLHRSPSGPCIISPISFIFKIKETARLSVCCKRKSRLIQPVIRLKNDFQTIDFQLWCLPRSSGVVKTDLISHAIPAWAVLFASLPGLMRKSRKGSVPIPVGRKGRQTHPHPGRACFCQRTRTSTGQRKCDINKQNYNVTW